MFLFFSSLSLVFVIYLFDSSFLSHFSAARCGVTLAEIYSMALKWLLLALSLDLRLKQTANLKNLKCRWCRVSKRASTHVWFKEATKRKFDSRKWYVPRHLTQIPSVDLHEFTSNAFLSRSQIAPNFELYWFDVTFLYFDFGMLDVQCHG